MTLEQAKEEAARRWTVWGGWARIETYQVETDHGKTASVTMCVVGIRRDAPPYGVEKVVLARGKTFEEAFDHAETSLRTRAEKGPGKRKPNPKALPQLELGLEKG